MKHRADTPKSERYMTEGAYADFWVEVEFAQQLELALAYCLRKLKAHHRTKPGITELVRKVEAMRDKEPYV